MNVDAKFTPDMSVGTVLNILKSHTLKAAQKQEDVKKLKSFMERNKKTVKKYEEKQSARSSMTEFDTKVKRAKTQLNPNKLAIPHISTKQEPESFPFQRSVEMAKRNRP